MTQQTVHLLIFDSMADWEASYAIAEIHSPFMPAIARRYRVQTVGITEAPVTTMGGVRLLPELPLAALDPADSALVIIPGGRSWESAKPPDVLPTVQHVLAAGVPVAAICGATGGLARAGLLDNVRHTSNALEYLQATGYRGAAHYQHVGAVDDGGLITAGATGALEFAAAIFRRLQLYPEAITDTWYQLFKTSDPAHFARLAAYAAG